MTSTRKQKTRKNGVRGKRLRRTVKGSGKNAVKADILQAVRVFRTKLLLGILFNDKKAVEDAIQSYYRYFRHRMDLNKKMKLKGYSPIYPIDLATKKAINSGNNTIVDMLLQHGAQPSNIAERNENNQAMQNVNKYMNYQSSLNDRITLSLSAINSIKSARNEGLYYP